MNKPKTQHSTAKHSTVQQTQGQTWLVQVAGHSCRMCIDWLQSLLAHLHVRDTSPVGKQKNKQITKKKSKTCSIQCGQLILPLISFLFVTECVSANLLLVQVLLASWRPASKEALADFCGFFPFPFSLACLGQASCQYYHCITTPFPTSIFLACPFCLFTCFWP